MSKSILITGGARSGKSGFAERMTLSLRGTAPVIYIATAQAWDDEMADRIARHQSRRGPEWRTVPAPMDVVDTVITSDGTGPRLLDCVTLWLSNMMLADRDWRAEIDALIGVIPHQVSPLIIVTNEVGAGIVPENALARRFRDAAGEANQMIAAAMDEVYVTISGQPLRVKPNDQFAAD